MSNDEAARWPRSRRFALTPKGTETVSDYRDMIVLLRKVSGRNEFDRITREWATSLGLQPLDGALLSELSNGCSSMEKLLEAFQHCGHSLEHIRAAMRRTVSAGLVLCSSPKSQLR